MTFLEQHKQRMRDRSRFQAHMKRAEFEHELWDAIRPFLRTVDDFRAASAFMAAMLRARARH